MPSNTIYFTWITNPVITAYVGIASLAIGVVSIIIGYWFYHKGKLIKRITYEVISDTSIMMVNNVGRGKIKVEYEDNSGHIEEINYARLLTIKIWNAGNTDIKIWNSNDQDIEDMEEPIEFEFDERTIVSLTNVATFPPKEVIHQKHLDAYLNNSLLSPNCLKLPHCLLKPKQSIEIVALLKGAGSDIRHKGKLINGEIIKTSDIEIYKSKSIIIPSILTLLLLLILSSLIPNTSSLMFYQITTTTGTILLVLWVIRRITSPYTCSCGFSSPFFGTFRKHLVRNHR